MSTSVSIVARRCLGSPPTVRRTYRSPRPGFPADATHPSRCKILWRTSGASNVLPYPERCGTMIVVTLLFWTRALGMYVS